MFAARPPPHFPTGSFLPLALDIVFQICDDEFFVVDNALDDTADRNNADYLAFFDDRQMADMLVGEVASGAIEQTFDPLARTISLTALIAQCLSSSLNFHRQRPGLKRAAFAGSFAPLSYA